MKTAELEGKILDYYVALAVGHVWRRKWDPEDENYTSWQSYEQGWGNPTPPYSSDWAVGGPVLEKERIAIIPDLGCPIYCAKFYDKTAIQWRFFESRTPLVAAMRAVVALHFGQDVPEVKL